MNYSHKIFGVRAIIEAIRSDKSINKIFLQKGIKGSLFKELEQLARSKSISISYVPTEKVNTLAKGKNHQGVVARIAPIEFYNLDTLMENIQSKQNKAPLILMLDSVSDVRNFGAIIRTAECTGVDGIIIAEKGSAPVTEDTVKTSAGAIFNIPICKISHLKDALFYLQSFDIQIIGATEKATKTVYQANLAIPTAIVMGAEDVGISPSMLKLLDDKIKLPLFGKIESLNVSVASAVVLYEVIRQRNFK